MIKNSTILFIYGNNENQESILLNPHELYDLNVSTYLDTLKQKPSKKSIDRILRFARESK